MTKTNNFRSAPFNLELFNSALLNRVNSVKLVILIYALTKATMVLAMTPPPPPQEQEYISPWEEWVAPLDPKPGKPSLSLETTLNGLDLSWSAVANANSYVVYANVADSGWQQVASTDRDGLFHRIDYQSRGWNLGDVSLKLFACKSKPLLLFWALWDTEDRCNHSNIVNVSDYIPTIELTAPVQDIQIDANYTIEWTANSPSHSGAAISLYYDTDNSGNDGQLITSSLIEGTHTSYIWDSLPIPSGDYYIYAKIDDGVTPPIYDYGDGIITINKSPGISLNPSTNAAANTSYLITWTAADVDDQATIAIYFDEDSSGFNGTLIADNLQESIDSSYTWDTSALAERDYYLYAIIDDGINPPVYQYASGKVIVRHPTIELTAPAQEIQINANYTIEWTARSLEGGFISLYYDNDNSGQNGQLIVGNLTEGAQTSYVWDSLPVTSGDYYIYANINDGLTPPVWDYSDGKITINKSPSITILNPSVDVGANSNYQITWTATDVDDQAAIALYYDDDDSDFDGTLITDSLIEGTHSSYTWDTSALAERDYYLYAIIDDGVNPPVYQYASGKVTIRHPTVEVTAPAQDIETNANYTIEWTARSLEGAVISLYYDNNNGGNDGQLIVSNLTEGAQTSYVWDNSSTPSGSYYIYAKIDDGLTPPVYDYSNGRITLNKPPSITLYPPTNVTANYSYRIYWSATDVDDQAGIALYHDDDNSGFNGTLITDSLLEGTHSNYEWDTSALEERDYYLYAIIDDGFNPPDYQYASGKVTIDFTIRHPLSDTGKYWGGNYDSGNNAGCTGETISQQDCSHGRDAQANAGTLTKIGGGAAGFDFTRLDADGSEYTGNGNYASDPWSCVRDNHTGLIWEVKTDDGGIHDKDNTYPWGGITSQSYGSGWGPYYNNWDTLVEGSNAASLCGLTDWRVPTLVELFTLTHRGTSHPSIDSNYFPNTQSNWYWVASSFAENSGYAWVVLFTYGISSYYGRNSYGYVRLVNNG